MNTKSSKKNNAAANPPIAADVPRNCHLKGAADVPRKIWRYHDMLAMPRGIEMKEYDHADGTLTFVGQYRRIGAPECAKPKRVYRVEVREIKPFGELVAAVFEDDVRLVKLGGGTSKWNLAYAALGALRGILHKRCTQTGSNRRARKAAANGEISAQ